MDRSGLSALLTKHAQHNQQDHDPTKGKSRQVGKPWTVRGAHRNDVVSVKTREGKSVVFRVVGQSDSWGREAITPEYLEGSGPELIRYDTWHNTFDASTAVLLDRPGRFSKHASHDQDTHGNRDGSTRDITEEEAMEALDRQLVMDAISRRTKGRVARTSLTDPVNLMRGKPSLLSDTRPMSGSGAQHRRIRAERRARNSSFDSPVSFTHFGEKVHGRIRDIAGDGTITVELEDDRGTVTIPPHSSKTLTAKALLAKHVEHDQGTHNPHKGKPSLPDPTDYSNMIDWGVDHANALDAMDQWSLRQDQKSDERNEKIEDIQEFDTEGFAQSALPSVQAAFNANPQWAVRFRTPEKMAQSVATTYQRIWEAQTPFSADDIDELEAYSAVTGHVPAELVEIRNQLNSMGESMETHGVDWIQGLINGPGWKNPLAKTLARYFAKHTPGGQDHEQLNHGRRGPGSAEGESERRGRHQPTSFDNYTMDADAMSNYVPPSGPTQPWDEYLAFDEKTKQELAEQLKNPPPPPAPLRAEDSPTTADQAWMSPRGIPAPPGEPTDLVNRTIQEGLENYGQRMKFIAENAGLKQMSYEDDVYDKETGELKQAKQRGVDTMGEFGNWDGNEFKGWSEERATLHSQMIDAAARKQIEANDGRLPKVEKQAIIMAGLPGAGKTFLLKGGKLKDGTDFPGLSDKFDLRDYAVVNADDMKEIIFEMAPVTDPTGGELDPGELSSMVHEESSKLAKQWRENLVDSGTNIALDITAANRDKTLRDIDKLKAAGYTVHVVHADVEVEEAVASALRRAGDGAITPGRMGRVVPPDFIRSMHNEDAGTDNISVAFNDYAERTNGQAYWYRNFPLSRSEPQLVWSRTHNVPEQQEFPTEASAA